jgi:hypothetical protein
MQKLAKCPPIPKYFKIAETNNILSLINSHDVVYMAPRVCPNKRVGVPLRYLPEFYLHKE